jgi:hypothetical protein
MRHGKLFDRDFSFSDPLLDLRFLRAVQPELDRFLDHRFRFLGRFALTDDPKLWTIRDIPAVIAGFNDSSELGKLHEKRLSHSPATRQPAGIGEDGERGGRMGKTLNRVSGTSDIDGRAAR